MAIELGWAASVLGWDRVIMVMNTAYGNHDDQIFDLKHRRWAFGYQVPQSAGNAEISTQKDRLVSFFKLALKAGLDSLHRKAVWAIGQLDRDCISILRGLGNADGFHHSESGMVWRTPAIRHLIRLDIVRWSHVDEVYRITYFGRQVREGLGFHPA